MLMCETSFGECFVFQEIVEAIVSHLLGSLTCHQLNCMPSCFVGCMPGLWLVILYKMYLQNTAVYTDA